jgi:hypothetical protein
MEVLTRFDNRSIQAFEIKRDIALEAICKAKGAIVGLPEHTCAQILSKIAHAEDCLNAANAIVVDIIPFKTSKILSDSIHPKGKVSPMETNENDIPMKPIVRVEEVRHNFENRKTLAKSVSNEMKNNTPDPDAQAIERSHDRPNKQDIDDFWNHDTVPLEIIIHRQFFNEVEGDYNINDNNDDDDVLSCCNNSVDGKSSIEMEDLTMKNTWLLSPSSSLLFKNSVPELVSIVKSSSLSPRKLTKNSDRVAWLQNMKTQIRTVTDDSDRIQLAAKLLTASQVWLDEGKRDM